MLGSVFLVFVISSVNAGLVRVECEGNEQIKTFFLELFVKNTRLFHLSHDEAIRMFPVEDVTVRHSVGNMSGRAWLTATIEMECSFISTLQCKTQGYHPVTHNYQNFSFPPKLQFNDVVLNKNITSNKVTLRKEDATYIRCSADMGMKHTNWSWEYRRTTEPVFNVIDHGDFQSFPAVLKSCQYDVSSRLTMIVNETGEFEFQCKTHGSTIGSIIIRVNNEDPVPIQSEALGNTLFVTSITTFFHFLLLPYVFSRWNSFFTYRETCFRLKLRTLISFIYWIVLSVVWTIVCYVYRSDPHLYGFIALAGMEIICILIYVSIRFYTCRHREGISDPLIGKLNNARVSSSTMAVILPLICWIMIRIYGGTGNTVLEVIFFLGAFFSIILFVKISFTREGKYWDDKLRTE